jgi:chaperonin GroES
MLKPLDDYVVIKPITEETKSSSGIILPDTIDKEKPEKGEVIAIGEGKLLENGQKAPMSVKPGDKVIFTKYSPNEVKFNDEDYFILRQADILAVIEGETAATPQSTLNEEPPIPAEEPSNVVPPSHVARNM